MDKFDWHNDFETRGYITCVKSLLLIMGIVASIGVYEVNVGFPKINEPFQREKSGIVSALSDTFETSTIARDWYPLETNK